LRDLDIALGDLFATHFGTPVLIDNDANVLTLAELWFGAGRALSNFVVVTIENGVGMGFVIDNQLFRGAHGMGLELGHTKVQLDGAICTRSAFSPQGRTRTLSAFAGLIESRTNANAEADRILF